MPVDAHPDPSPREFGSAASATLWGLDAEALHDAYWASLGVCCVRRGGAAEPQDGADLHLLLEPGQFVWFDLRSIAETLVWSGADVVRVEILQRDEDYAEVVVADRDGRVERIRRRYGSEERGHGSVLLARHRREAEIWSGESERDAAFDAFRRSRLFRVDRARADGVVLGSNAADAMERLLPILVRNWPRPDRVIDGLVELAPIGAGRKLALGDAMEGGSGIFAPEEDAAVAERDRTRVGPLWVGFRETPTPLEAVGPAIVGDEREGRPRVALRVRAIEEIFSPTERSLSVRRAGQDGLYPTVKRGLDIVGSLVALLVASPVLLAAAIAIVVEDGRPILFAQNRQAMGGRTFRCWKLRTMRRDSERREAELRARNLCDGPQVLIRDDPRVTRVGRILRRLQIDEVPQFWNVLIGDMSIVGPRPSPERENQFCPAWREARLSVRPGITGLWQVMRTREPGRDFQEWIRWDMEYVRRMGLLLDVRICFQTAWNLLRPAFGNLADRIVGRFAAVQPSVDGGRAGKA